MFETFYSLPEMSPNSVLSLLIVDDHEADRESLGHFLREGFPSINLDEVSSMQKALTKLEHKKYDCIIAEYRLKDADSRSLLFQLSSAEKNIPVIVYTSENDPLIAVEMLKSGAVDYIPKNRILGASLARRILNGIRYHKAEESLRETEDRIRLIIETSQDAFVGFSREGQIMEWNPRAERLFGWSRREVLGQSFVDLLFRDSGEREKVSRIFDKEFLQSTQVLDFRVQKKEGEEVDVEMSVSQTPLRNKLVYHSFIRDISERKKAEEMKEEFISTVSHELRTPITIIKSAIGNLKDGILGELSEKQARVVETTSRNIDRLVRLISDLLDLSRLESGHTEVHFTELDLPVLIEEVIHDFEVQTREKGIRIQSSFTSSLIPVFADADMIIQVFNNLLGNALRFTKDRIDVEASLKDFSSSGGWVEVRISDNGCGISQEDIPLVFKKFRQINRPAGGNHYKGTGLGLPICREIIERHGGKLWVVSDGKNGATFCFCLKTKQ